MTLLDRRIGPSTSENRVNFNFATLGTVAWWIDFDDASTIFQDTAGTSPVTTIGQSILRVNDKSGNGRNITNSSSINCPTYVNFGNSKMGANFSGGQYLSTALASTMNLLYLGGAFTLIFHLKRTGSIQYQVLLDSTNWLNTDNGISIVYNTPATVNTDYFYYSLTNNYTHTESAGKTTTIVQDPEYINMTSGNIQLLTNEYAISFANDVNNGYSTVNTKTTVQAAATGSPAGSTGSYPVRIGAKASDGNQGWRGYIRRVVCYSSFLSPTNLATAMRQIQL